MIIPRREYMVFQNEGHISHESDDVVSFPIDKNYYERGRETGFDLRNWGKRPTKSGFLAAFWNTLYKDFPQLRSRSLWDCSGAMHTASSSGWVLLQTFYYELWPQRIRGCRRRSFLHFLALSSSVFKKFMQNLSNFVPSSSPPSIMVAVRSSSSGLWNFIQRNCNWISRITEFFNFVGYYYYYYYSILEALKG
jgi:hypothetical protein